MSASAPPFDVKSVKGNVPEDVKEFLNRLILQSTFSAHTDRQGFGDLIALRLKLIEASVRPNDTAPGKKVATVVCDLVVEEDMLNGNGHLQGGCSAYLIDICTTLPLAILGGKPGVSQAINMIYHAPASLGAPLRIISTSIAVGGRTMTAQGEIWDTKNGRLVASGTHNKMLPSKPKL